MFLAIEQLLFAEFDVPPTEDVFVKFAYESVIFLISAKSIIEKLILTNVHILDTT